MDIRLAVHHNSFIPRILLALTASLSVNLASDAIAQFEMQKVVIFNTLSERVFDSMCDHLELDEPRLIIAKAHFLAYKQVIDSFDKSTRRAMIDAGDEEYRRLIVELDPYRFIYFNRLSSWEEYEEARRLSEERKNDPRWADVKRLKSQIVNAQGQGQRDAWRKFHSLFDSISADCELDDDQLAKGLRFVFRMLFEPPPGPDTPKPSFDFMDTVDVLVLIDDANEEDGEITRLLKAKSDRVRLPTMAQSLAQIKLDYEIELHAHLERNAPRKYRRRKPDEPISIDSTDPGWAKLEKKLAQPWIRRYRISNTAVNRITMLLREGLGEDEVGIWIRRFHTALAPNLMAERWPEHDMLKWIESRDDVTDDQLELARALQAEYRDRLKHLIDTALRQGIVVKRDLVFPVGDAPIVLRYARSQLDIHKLSRSTIRRLHVALTPEQQSALVALLNENNLPPPANLLRLGPRIDSVSLDALDDGQIYKTPIFVRSSEDR